MPDLISTLQHALEAPAVLLGEDIQEKNCVDWSGENALTPRAVLRPSSTEEISMILKFCNKAGQPVVVQGGMTGLSGGATPRAGEVALSLERMSGIEEIDSESMTITVLAGTPLELIQNAAKEAGLFLPLDLGARGSCTIGGNVATNAGGNQVIRYGMTRALVLGLEAVLADGTVISSMNKLLKNNAGFDLKHLFIGTEGTLGVVARVVLRLYPRMNSTCTALCALLSFGDVVTLFRRVQSAFAGGVSSFEVMWANYFEFVVNNAGHSGNPFKQSYPLYVLLEYQGSDLEVDSEKLEQVLFAEMESGLVQDTVIAQSIKETETLWQIRDGIADVLPLLGPTANFDIGIPINHMESFLDVVDQKLHFAFPDITLLVFGHIGDGNLHIAASTGGEQDKQKIYDIVYHATGEYQGSVTAEHGIGVLKKDYLSYSRNAEELALMRQLKAALDPKNILNAGRVIA